MKDISEINEMFLKVYNKEEMRISNHFSRDYFTQICDIIADLKELNEYIPGVRNIYCNISVSYDSCFVEFIRLNERS